MFGGFFFLEWNLFFATQTDRPSAFAMQVNCANFVSVKTKKKKNGYEIFGRDEGQLVVRMYNLVYKNN